MITFILKIRDYFEARASDRRRFIGDVAHPAVRTIGWINVRGWWVEVQA